MPDDLAPVALSLSGGGFRAAGYHLGALALLDRVGLLDQVGALSTVSGGTLVGASWALSRARGESFQAFADRFVGFLDGSDLMAAAVARATSDGRARGSLIRAVAELYDQRLFEGARFKEVLDATSGPSEVSFNATELRTGVAFRFQRSASRWARVGNANVSIPREQAAQLRLADIAAASACFPGGFEPMVLPDDFRVGDVEIAVAGGPVALMDGGIYDNQGVGALLLDRKPTVEPGLLIISDTSPELGSFRMRGERPGGFPSLRAVWRGALVGGWSLAGLLLVQAAAWGWVGQPMFAALDLMLAGVVGSGTAGVVLAKRGLARWLAATVPGADLDALGALSAGELRRAVDLRVRSLGALTNDIFMRRVRALVYDQAYAGEGKLGRRSRRRLTNLIYRMPQKTGTHELFASLKLPLPSELGLDPVVERAARLPTALWFPRASDREAAVRCGYASMCFNLLDHVLRRYGDDASVYPPVAAAVRRRCERIWREGAHLPAKAG